MLIVINSTPPSSPFMRLSSYTNDYINKLFGRTCRSMSYLSPNKIFSFTEGCESDKIRYIRIVVVVHCEYIYLCLQHNVDRLSLRISTNGFYVIVAWYIACRSVQTDSTYVLTCRSSGGISEALIRPFAYEQLEIFTKVFLRLLLRYLSIASRVCPTRSLNTYILAIFQA